MSWQSHKVSKLTQIWSSTQTLILVSDLTFMYQFIMIIFIVIRELYCIQVINDVKKMFIHSISMNKYSAEHVESRL